MASTTVQYDTNVLAFTAGDLEEPMVALEARVGFLIALCHLFESYHSSFRAFKKTLAITLSWFQIRA